MFLSFKEINYRISTLYIWKLYSPLCPTTKNLSIIYPLLLITITNVWKIRKFTNNRSPLCDSYEIYFYLHSFIIKQGTISFIQIYFLSGSFSYQKYYQNSKVINEVKKIALGLLSTHNETGAAFFIFQLHIKNLFRLLLFCSLSIAETTTIC